ncbi:MAG: M15 family metallopeptidase [Bacillota bacterium]
MILAPALVLVVLLGGLLLNGGGYRREVPAEKGLQPVRPATRPTDFVNLKEYIPSLDVELIYCTADNFTGKKLYDEPVAYLRKGTADKLKLVAAEVAGRGYRLKIWDAYRPPRVQFEMWLAVPDRRFVADPHTGFSAHSRGCAVDLTLIDAAGRELDMPSAFDDFSPRADRNYSDVSPVQAANARYLERVMVKYGFVPSPTEWWHFVDADRGKYGVVEDVYLPDAPAAD